MTWNGPIRKPQPRACAARVGFTLTELLIVISIIAILLGILLPVLSGARNSARETQATALVRQVTNAIEAFNTEVGRLPGRWATRNLAIQAENQIAGFTESENVLLDLGGGVVTGEEAEEADLGIDSPYLRVGPFVSPSDRIIVNVEGVGAIDQAGYLGGAASVVDAVEGQAGSIDVVQGTTGDLIKGMPDIIDPFGQPLMMFAQDVKPQQVDEVADFALNEFEPGGRRSAFYWMTNVGYLSAGDGAGGSAGDRGLGEDRVRQFTESLLGTQVPAGESGMTDQREANLAAVLGSPNFPSPRNVTVPSRARGSIVVMSAGVDGVYFAKNETLVQGAGAPQTPQDAWRIGYARQGYFPNDMETLSELAKPVEEFDDLIMAVSQ